MAMTTSDVPGLLLAGLKTVFWDLQRAGPSVGQDFDQDTQRQGQRALRLAGGAAGDHRVSG